MEPEVLYWQVNKGAIQEAYGSYKGGVDGSYLEIHEKRMVL